MNIGKVWKCFFLIFLLTTSVKAQDTIKMCNRQADSMFLKNSFYLLASLMNIKAQEAQIIQAKLYPNPVFTADFNAYDPDNNKAFHIGKTGQKEFQLEQLIVLGGKRKLEIEMAKTNVAIAELEFEQLSRNLKYLLQRSLYTVGQQEFILHKYIEQLALLDKLLLTYQNQVDNGNIALKELVRLKGAYLKLNNDRAAIFREYNEAQSILQNILQTPSLVKFDCTEEDIKQYVKQTSLEELKAAASENRSDFLIMQQNKLLSEQYLQYQKKMVIPDVNLFTAYDQQGGVFQNEVRAGISVPLPLWNRNQGEIKMAQFKLQETGYQVQAMQNEMYSAIRSAYAYYIQTVTEYEKASSLYNQDFETTIKGMTDNFQKRNVSIVEFIDFFEAYNEVLTELTRIKIQLVSSAEELNLLTGEKLF